MKSDMLDNRMNLSNHRSQVPVSKMQSGSIANKYPVILDDGKTIIYISDKSLETETRYRYALRRR